MNKKEIEDKIEEIEKQLEELKKEVSSIEDEKIKKGVRQMPEMYESYYYVGNDGNIYCAGWVGSKDDLFRFNTGNCFKTEQEVLDFKENLLTKQQLKDLALELNEGVEIDWDDFYQEKYRIFSVGDFTELECEYVGQTTDIGQVYCLDENFLTIAEERIGKEKIIKLIESGI